MPSCGCGVSSAGCSAIASSAGVDVGMSVGVSCTGEATEPATGIISDSVTGSVMSMLLIGSAGCACGAHGADAARSVVAAGTASTLAVPPQNAQHSAEAARTVPAMILRFLIIYYLHNFGKQHIPQNTANSQTFF